MVLTQLTNEEFKSFSHKFPIKSLYQTKEYADTMLKQNYDSIFLGLKDETNTCIAASLILIEKKDTYKYAYAPRGFLIDYNNVTLLNIFTEEIKKYLNKMDICAIKISPNVIYKIHDVNSKTCYTNPLSDTIINNLKQQKYIHTGFNNYFETLKPRFEAILDLNSNYEFLFNNFYKETRTKIRNAANSGILIYKGKQEDLKYLYAHTKNKYPRDLQFFDDCFTSFNVTNNVDFFYAKLDTELYIKHIQNKYNQIEHDSNKINAKIINNKNKNNNRLINKKIALDKNLEKYKHDLVQATNLLMQYPDGIVLASSLIIKNENEVYLFMDGMNPNYKYFNAKHLLIWKIIEKYAKAGYSKFNLGGCSNPNLNNNPYAGLNNFKLSFNAKIYEYIGDFELIINKTKHFMYQNSISLKNILKK